MPAKFNLKFTKGSLKGKELSFEQKEILIIGRSNDCNLVIPEPTISRFHCLIEIAPPTVMVKDYGSLNGTFLNGEEIGKRHLHLSAEERRKLKFDEFEMKSGDILGLGKDCEIALEVISPFICAICDCEMEKEEYYTALKFPICKDCFNKQMILRKEEEEARLAFLKHKEERVAAEQRANELKEKEKAALDEQERIKAEQARKEQERIAAELEKKIKAEEVRKKRAEEAKREAEREKNMQLKILEDLINEAKIVPKVPLQNANKNEDFKDISKIVGYTPIKVLGKGGMGAVFLVREDATGKEMALKIMLPEVAGDEHSRATFVRELYVTGQLAHKNVVKQFNAGVCGNIYFMLLEFCNGGCVDSLMKKNGGKLNEELATKIFLQVLDGLIYSHAAEVVATLRTGENVSAKGIVHRDLKPANFFLTYDNNNNLIAKVADFGLAKTFDTAGLSGHTQTGAMAGTPVFMPRQQLIDFKYSKPMVDVWSAAASFYNMLTGRVPRVIDLNKFVDSILTNPTIPILRYNPKINPKLARVIDLALTETRDSKGIYQVGIKTVKELKEQILRAIS